VLANEPPSASEARFASQMPSESSGSSSASLSNDDDDDGEFDAQLEQIENDMKKLRENIRESEECARRLNEQQAELRSLEDQKAHIEKEKEKRILQIKLEKQMKDLAEINKMSRALRAKFSELKRTQNILKTKLTGTRSSLNQLDAEPDVSTEDFAEKAEDLSSEMQAMQNAQQKILSNSHKQSAKEVKDSLNQANRVHKATQKELAAEGDI
jgi:DNA repair exonuclease SbcCD ATPase subunit